MNIGIIANGFTGATLPLANHLVDNGHHVDCYYLVFKGTTMIESLDFDHSINGSKIITINKSNQIYSYLNPSTDINILPNYPVFRRHKAMLIGYIRKFLNKNSMKHYAKQIVEKKYDVLFVVIHTENEIRLCNYFKNAGIPIVIAFHEVLKNHMSNRVLKPVVKEALDLNTEIVVHSERTKEDIIQQDNSNLNEERIHVIPFGAFESYSSYQINSSKLPNNYFLYLGRITPYKGLKYLYKAFTEDERLKGFHVVVAGKGNDEILESMLGNSQFTLINKYVTNQDLVNLMAHCRAVICPYLSASQSGLVQTAAIFGKPVVATKVGAFSEIITEGKNGFFADAGDSRSLADAIFRMAKSNLSETNKSTLPDSFQWENIVLQYEQVFNKVLSDN